jgi:outer membrane protein assembly factor BamB
MGSSPLLVGDLLVIQVDHWSQSYLLGVDARSGANRWRTLRDASVNWSSPVLARVGDRPQLLVAGTYRVQGYDPETGSELWSLGGMQMQCIPSPVVVGDRAYAVSGYSGDCIAFRLDGGRGDLTDSHVVWKRKKPKMPYITSPVCYDGRCYLVQDNLGMGLCLDAATGAEVWHQRLGGEYRASPVAGDGKVYFASMAGVVTVVKAGAKFEVLARNDLSEGLAAEPAVADGCLFLRGLKHLYCIGEK